MPEVLAETGQRSMIARRRANRVPPLMLDGMDRTMAVRSYGMDRQTVRDWVHRNNLEGFADLSDRLTRLTPERKRELAVLVGAGPDLETDGGYAGAGPIFRPASRICSGSRCMRARSASNWPDWASCGTRHGRSIPRPTRWCRRLSRKLRRTGRSRPARAGPRQVARSLVSRGGTRRPTGHADPPLVAQGLATARAARPALRLGRPVRVVLGSSAPRTGRPGGAAPGPSSFRRRPGRRCRS